MAKVKVLKKRTKAARRLAPCWQGSSGTSQPARDPTVQAERRAKQSGQAGGETSCMSLLSCGDKQVL